MTYFGNVPIWKLRRQKNTLILKILNGLAYKWTHIWGPSHIRRYQMFITLAIGANFATVNFITEHGIPNRNL